MQAISGIDIGLSLLLVVGCVSRPPEKLSEASGERGSAACPLVVKEVSVRRYAGGRANKPSSVMLFFTVTNSTNAKIVGAEIRAEFWHAPNWTIPDISNINLSPHSERLLYRVVPVEFRDEALRHTKLAATKVSFEDGSKWNADDSDRCSGTASEGTG